MSFGSAYLTLPDFVYHKPSSVNEVLALLKEHGDDAKIMAGGVGVIAFMKERLMSPEHLIDVKGIEELRKVELVPRVGLRIGATVTYEELAASELLRSKYGVLHDVAGRTGDPMIRARATLVGNICEAIPWIDSAPALIALEASVEIVGPSGKRQVPVEGFIRGPVDIDLGPEEFVTAVVLPEKNASALGAFEKFTAGSEFSVASVAITILPGRSVRLVFGSVNSTPARSKNAERLLSGSELTMAKINSAAKEAANEVECVDDVLATSAYRKHLVEILTLKALWRLAHK